MTIGGILDKSLRIYKNNFVRFIVIIAIVNVPLSLISFAAMSTMQKDFLKNAQLMEAYQEDGNTEDTEIPVPALPGKGAFAGIFITTILAVVGYILTQGALAKNVSEYYLGKTMSVTDTYKAVLPKLITLVIAGILVWFIVMIGFILLVVPGIIFLLWYSLITPAIVIEDLKALKSLGRSKALVSKNLGKVFLVGFLVMLIAIAVNSPFIWGGQFLSAALFSNNLMPQLILNQFFNMIGTILVTPIGATAYILLYYDLRIRKEGFDLEMLALSMNPSE